MKNDVNNTTEKLGVSKDEASSSDNKENRNNEIVNISMTVKRWYSAANLIYSLLVGYVWVRYIIGNPASRTILRLIGSIFVLMILCIPYAVKEKQNCQSGFYGWLCLLCCLRWQLLGLQDDVTSINEEREIPGRQKVVRM